MKTKARLSADRVLCKVFTTSEVMTSWQDRNLYNIGTNINYQPHWSKVPKLTVYSSKYYTNAWSLTPNISTMNSCRTEIQGFSRTFIHLQFNQNHFPRHSRVLKPEEKYLALSMTFQMAQEPWRQYWQSPVDSHGPFVDKNTSYKALTKEYFIQVMLKRTNKAIVYCREEWY